MINNLVVLTPSDEKQIPTKTLDKDLNVIESFPKAMKSFYFDQIEYENFHTALERVFKLKNSFIVLGKLTELGEYYKEEQQEGFRRKKEPKATLQDNNSTEIVLDLDDHVLEGFDPLNPEYSIEYFLQENNINCDCTWQITSSQKLATKENPEPLARIRLYFSAHKRFSLKHRKAWSQKFIESDGSVYTCSQPIYTAPPQIIGKDPIKKRTGFIKGVRKTFILPMLTDTEIIDNCGYSRNSDFDFDDSTIPAEVLSGNVYRRYFMPLAFHYANKGLSEEDVLMLVATKSLKVTSREFDETNTKEYISDAFKQISREKESIQTQKPDIDKKIDPFPFFPKNIEKCMPPVVAKLWKEFKKLPLDLNETILFPTFVAVHGHLLKGKFVTGYGRIPNTLSLTLADSSAGKDLNSTNVISTLNKLVLNNSKSSDAYQTIFSEMLVSPDDISSGSNYIKAFNKTQDFFWLNTEATSFYSMLNNSKNLSAVTSISLKLINSFDGEVIQGNAIKSNDAKSIINPNNQVIQLAQQKIIRESLKESIIESGYFGRMNLYMVEELGKEGIEKFRLKRYSTKIPDVDQDVLDFYSNNSIWNKVNASRNMQERIVITDEESNDVLDLIQELIVEKEKLKSQDEDLFGLKIPIMGRIQMTLEKFHCIFVGITKMWNEHISDENEKFDEKFDSRKLLPLMEYLNDTKMYAIDNIIVKKNDPIFEAIIEEINNFVSGEKKIQGTKQNEILKEHRMVTKAILKTKLVRNSALGNEVDNPKDLGNKISFTMFNMVKDGILIEKEIGRGVYVGISKSE